jgi:hypothetical protein
MGFKANEYDYIQPPYDVDKKAVPMVLMSYPELLSEEVYTKIRDRIHKEVYGFDKPILKI